MALARYLVRDRESRITTHFRIDLPTRSGHIEGGGRCQAETGRNGAVRMWDSGDEFDSVVMPSVHKYGFRTGARYG